jgi:hypothetical protein
LKPATRSSYATPAVASTKPWSTISPFITYLSETKIKPDGPLFEVAVIHDNKCGTSFLANEDFRHNFATHIDGDEAALSAEAVTDPEQTAKHDVELPRSATTVSTKITVSGYVDDVDTGQMTTIVPAAPMRTTWRVATRAAPTRSTAALEPCYRNP